MASHANSGFHAMEDDALNQGGLEGGRERMARRDRPSSTRRRQRQARRKRGAAPLGVCGRGNRRSTYRALRVGKMQNDAD